VLQDLFSLTKELLPEVQCSRRRGGAEEINVVDRYVKGALRGFGTLRKR
jgi:hypothetical protein